MVLLGGLEVLAAGYLIKQHLKHKEERQRLEIEALNLEEQSYRIHSPDCAGPSQRRQRPSHGRDHDGEYDRDRRRERSKERRHRRRDSPERKYTSDRRERDDKRRSREDVRYTNSPPPKGYYAPQPRSHGSQSQMRQPEYSQTGAPSAQWVPPPPQQRMNSPPIITTTPPFTRHPQPYPAYQVSPPPAHPTFANEPYAYPPEKLPESMLRPGVPARGRSSSAPGDIYPSSRAETSRVRIAVPGEDELTIPGETRDPPPAYENIGGRY
ncbi:hypothetical protein DSL72_001655 [Monilinia vaccinii-corymbosi]|uniref:Uncharacterized protein n=1 Tax=Monilinia vaccinii-corymbosi TaxID=61207 RepID=A0A8A3P7Q0_9HELO|nr:hypothetical protein DSL72_001655 [Monilinia vaccinii-corymbosi]